MKIRELLKKIDDKVRPPHVKGHDVNEAFSAGAGNPRPTFTASQQDKKPS
jgi:hypothetical protein